ncbi:MAG: hypothetical protein AVDCRST_MAG70-1895, partial [uncultured Thermomicrobiales bacterium]
GGRDGTCVAASFPAVPGGGVSHPSGATPGHSVVLLLVSKDLFPGRCGGRVRQCAGHHPVASAPWAEHRTGSAAP